MLDVMFVIIRVIRLYVHIRYGDNLKTSENCATFKLKG